MGQEEVMAVFDEEKRDLTAQEIEELLLKKGIDIGIKTLRANLSRLKKHGALKKITWQKWRKVK